MTDDKDDSSALPSAERPVSAPVKTGAPNPQGKGQVGFLADWARHRPQSLVAKRPAQLLADYFTSLLVLSSTFGFKPVSDQNYYLYLEDDSWKLSLISPEEWDDDAKYRGFVGTCVLHEDATWSIEPSGNLGEAGPIAEALAAVYESFIDKLHGAGTLEDDLPRYEGRLPYYQRVFAAALGQSIRGSIDLGGQSGLAGANWLRSLPRDAAQLLGHLDDDCPSSAASHEHPVAEVIDSPSSRKTGYCLYPPCERLSCTWITRRRWTCSLNSGRSMFSPNARSWVTR